MSKSLFSAIAVSGLMVCTTLSAAVTTASLSAAADVVTMPAVSIVGKRADVQAVVVMPTVHIVARRDTAVQVASR